MKKNPRYRYNWLAGRFVPASQYKPKPGNTDPDQAEFFFLLLILFFCLGMIILAIATN